jgi:hypothetical protein
MASLSHKQRNWMPVYYSILATFSAILLAIRLLSRLLRVGGRFGIDDFFITLAWLVSVPAGVLSVIGLFAQFHSLNIR